ncbi:DUF4310 family protein [Abyssisolibacter fermentans]|uniref:DUF4310 family protein n=1 Tax=Abyssisolibacter fermentans TaxID=1766203 RepID=UPI000A923D32|nr:DUF4310 family protein [Abyssisolibacter fermentans]
MMQSSVINENVNKKDDFKIRANNFLMTEKAFIILMMLACAGVFAGTHIFLKFHTGSFSTTSVTVMLSGALESGDYAALIGFAGGFLIARILEGPLVGILDIGGSIMTGVGTGLPALFLSLGYKTVLDNFILSLIVGAGIGLTIAIIILVVRKIMPSGYNTMGTDVMMGAGNIVGKWFGPIIIIMALKYNFAAGMGAVIGAAICHKKDKPIIGGAVLGAMFLGAIYMYV